MAENAEDAGDFAGDESAQEKQTTAPPRNAFTELMAPKTKPPKPDAGKSSRSATGKGGKWTGALVEYIEHPERFPREVLRVTPNTVLIKDLYPKATIHLLLLPRDPAHYLMNPREAFDDVAFLSMMRNEAASAARIAAAELSRQLSLFSASSHARNEAVDAGVPAAELPPGRDFLSEMRIGVHAHPSMDHLHVHIFSPDMHSDKVKHYKHYNSFNTPFFIPLDDFPLAADDERRSTAFQNANLKRDFVCWRCGKVFGNKFAELKRHLEIEFELWKKT
ncbi:HIT-like domain-containing protein [Lasiosphaeria ovina]|uniref:Aprataxin-like protein n=1 Tax=Lasiosphaeria ovina TaxID=92902 RepID=A0AAE0KLH5_9PEZI|nr:HIT-like domain-containing protein [Lasiosphaeria ovina]